MERTEALKLVISAAHSKLGDMEADFDHTDDGGLFLDIKELKVALEYMIKND